jgi:hypothetical protein
MAKKREMENKNEVIVGDTQRKKPVRRPTFMCDDTITTCLEGSRQELWTGLHEICFRGILL